MSGPVRLAVFGASGRMGRAVLRALATDPDFELAGALVSKDSRTLGQDAGGPAGLKPFGVLLTADRPAALQRAQVVLDFSVGAAPANLDACLKLRLPLLLGTTGLDAGAKKAVRAAGEQIAVLEAPNTSLGVAVLTHLVREAALKLPPSYDIDVLELHHRHKRDSPSGTAQKLAAAATGARGLAGLPAAGRTGGVGIASLRLGDIVGEHTVLFAGSSERLELTHRAQDRAAFAHGALVAARWLLGRAPGHYAMEDVLGLGP